VLIGLALFLAIGLEPAVSVLARRWCRDGRRCSPSSCWS
jgi:hypothetical protein